MSIGLRDALSYLANAPDTCNPNSRVWAIEQARAKNLAVTSTMAGGRSRISGWNPAMVMLQCTEVDNPVEVMARIDQIEAHAFLPCVTAPV